MGSWYKGITTDLQSVDGVSITPDSTNNLGETMEFLVLPRYKVKDYVTDKKHILISIYCHDDTPAELDPNPLRLAILPLQFDDWDTKAKESIETKYKNSAEAQKQIFFSEEHAKQIIEFVRRYSDKIDLIICQCAAGISRSAGVAAALSKCLNGEDGYFFKNYLPNSLVYSTILKVWSS